MKITKDDIEVKMEIPGAVIRQKTDFGDATGLGKMSGEYFSLSAGVDTTPLFIGLYRFNTLLIYSICFSFVSNSSI